MRPRCCSGFRPDPAHRTARINGSSAANISPPSWIAAAATPGTFLGKPDASRPLAGSEVGFQIPGLGVFFPPNLTPDKATGLGNWSEAEIIAAIRTGIRPDGRMLVPIMPYKHYGALTDEDAGALAAYLKSIPPVANQVPAMTGASEKPAGPYLTVAMP